MGLGFGNISEITMQTFQKTLQIGLDVSPSVYKEQLKKNNKCTVIFVKFVCLRNEACLSSACLRQSSKKLRLVEIGLDFFCFLILVQVATSRTRSVCLYVSLG